MARADARYRQSKNIIESFHDGSGKGLRQATFEDIAHLLRASILTCIGAPRREGPRKSEVLGLIVAWESVEEEVCVLSLEEASLFLVMVTSARV